MAAVVLGSALETALLGYILVEWGEDNGGELNIPDDVSLNDLIAAADHFELLNAVKFRESEISGEHPVEKVRREIQWMRNNLHPAKALRKSFHPGSFDQTQYERLRKIYRAVIDNLLYYL
jgi:hypothetical protein